MLRGPQTLARRLLRRRRVCGRTLWLGLLLVAQTACLIPQEDPILDPLPPPRNRPPRILENLVSPPRSFPAPTYFTGQNCPPIVRFEAVVADPDIDDLITARWFVDYDPLNNPVVWKEDRIPPSGQEVRTTASALLELNTTTGPLSVAGPHLIEVFVSDSQLINRDPQPREIDPDGGIINPGYVDTYAWYINIENQVCAP